MRERLFLKYEAIPRREASRISIPAAMMCWIAASLAGWSIIIYLIMLL